MNILVTGEARYIGNHTLVELLNTVKVVDTFVNRIPHSLEGSQKITRENSNFSYELT